MTREELAELAAGLGHDDVRIEQTTSGRRYAVSCGCGWGAPMDDGRPTVTRATLAEAVRTCEHHVATAVDRWRRERASNGVSQPPVVRSA